MEKLLKRPWYEWIGWALWLAVTVVFLQTAIASRVELAYRAATISWAIVLVLVVFAAIIWGRRVISKQ